MWPQERGPGPGQECVMMDLVTYLWNTLYSYLMAHGGPCIHISWSTHGGPCGNRSFPLLLNLNYKTTLHHSFLSLLSCYNCYWGQMSVIFCYLLIFPSFRELLSAEAEQSKWIIFNFLRLSRKWWKTIIKWFPRKYFLAFSVELNSKWCQWD